MKKEIKIGIVINLVIGLFSIFSIAHADTYLPNVRTLLQFNTQSLSDRSGNGHDFTSHTVDTGTGSWTTTSSVVGSNSWYMHTDYSGGHNGQASLFGSSSSISLSGDFSAFLWMQPQNLPSFLASNGWYILGRYIGGAGQQMLSYSISCTDHDMEYVNGPCLATTHYDFSTNSSTWYLFELKRSGTTVSVSINNTLLMTGTDATTTNINAGVGINGLDPAVGGSVSTLLNQFIWVDRAVNSTEENEIYNNGSGTLICVTVGCSGGGGSALLGNFSWPPNAGPMPDFTNWVINISGPSSSNVYAKIDYQRGSDWTFVNRIYEDQLNYNLGSNTNATLPVLKSTGLWNTVDQNNAPTTTFPWIARLYLSTQSDYSDVTTSSAEIKFTIGVTSSSVALTTSTQNAGPFLYNPFQLVPSYDFQSVTSSVANLFSGSSSQECPLPDSWYDIGGGMYYSFCRIANWAFTPDWGAVQNFNSAVSSTLKVWPVSWLTVTGQSFSIAANATASTQYITADDFPNGIDGTTSSLAMQDPTHNTQFGTVLARVMNAWFNLVLLGFIGLILICIIIVIRHRN